RIGDLLRTRMLPAEAPVPGSGGSEVGRAVRHVDQIFGMQWRELTEAGARDNDRRNCLGRYVSLARCVRCGLSNGVVGMPAWHELECHVGGDVPAVAQIAGN